jgi:hypothetical protein
LNGLEWRRLAVFLSQYWISSSRLMSHRGRLSSECLRFLKKFDFIFSLLNEIIAPPLVIFIRVPETVLNNGNDVLRPVDGSGDPRH